MQCPCNTCSINTEHNVLYSELLPVQDSDDLIIEKSIFVLRCRGCKTATIREDLRGFDDQVQTVYKPPRLWTRSPVWIQKLEELDDNIYNLLVEVYSAANDEQFRLLAMGVRAVLDHLMTRIVGDIGSFERKLSDMVTKAHISSRQKEMLDIVIDAGSAAAHRGYKPPRDLLEQMVAVMETIVRDHYITGPMLETIKTTIPPRPPRNTT